MKVQGKDYQTIWINEANPEVINIIDQRHLPYQFIIEDLHSVNEVVQAIKDMHVRGAGLIGAAAGYGMYLAALEASRENSQDHLSESAELLKAARPTAVNLEWAVDRQLEAIAKGNNFGEKIEIAREMA